MLALGQSWGRLDVMWPVSMPARPVTTWNKACAKRLAPLISYNSQTKYCRQYCSVGDIFQDWNLELFQDASFAGEVVPISWMCKEDNISLDSLQALEFWDGVKETCSHSDAKGNVTRPSGNRHSSSHSIHHMSLDVVDHVSSNIPKSSFPAEDSEAVIRMIMQGCSPNYRHVSLTHRVTVLVPFDLCVPQNIWQTC